MSTRNAVVLLSGGLDSTVLLYHLIREGFELRALAFNYGQRHKKELRYARNTARRAGVPFTIVELGALRTLLPGSSQTDPTVPVPEGNYAEESMKATVVPNRNMIMLAVAVGHALAHKMGNVAIAAHAGDHAIYPDCRPEFFNALRKAVALCDWQPAQILSPFISRTKGDIARIGADLQVDFSKTWSCYKGEDLHCGRCGTCVERREAFHLAGVTDPTTYAPTAPTVEEMVKKGWRL